MKTLFLLLLFCHGSSAVKQFLKFSCTASTGLSNFPEFVLTAEFGGILIGYCDTNIKTVEIKQDWAKMFYKNNPQHLELFKAGCLERLPVFFKATIDSLKQLFNQSGGVHVLQNINGCEWNDEMGQVNSFNQFGYDGEDFISLDLKTLTWIPLKPQAVTIKLSWDADKAIIRDNEVYLRQECPKWLKVYAAYDNSSLLRTGRPSVSLLQKTPSSPVSCHATGFYPERATLSWRKDGGELHEDVELGEILPNNDGTFQMSAELKLSSVTPEDWSRYTCVFQLSGVKEDIITKLDKADVRTNWEERSEVTFPIVASVVFALLLLIIATGFFTIYKSRKARPSPDPDDDSELSENLNPRPD